MTNEKLISTLGNYRDKLVAMGVEVEKLPEDSYSCFASSIGRGAILSHQLYLCITGIEHVEKGNVDKGMRWLGHIQGVLWAHDIYTLDDEMNHSRP